MSEWANICPAAPTFSITHWLNLYSGEYPDFYFCEGNMNAATAPVVTTYKGNIYYDTSQRSNPVGFGNANASNQPANVVIPSGTDYNTNWNFVPFVTAPYTTACGSCTNGGSPYAVPMTGSAPGAHDQNINPRVANARTAYTWSLTRGRAATLGGFVSVFLLGGPSLMGPNISALFQYINSNNVPVQSLWNAMPDGTTIGPAQPLMFPLPGGTAMRTVPR